MRARRSREVFKPVASVAAGELCGGSAGDPLSLPGWLPNAAAVGGRRGWVGMAYLSASSAAAGHHLLVEDSCTQAKQVLQVAPTIVLIHRGQR